MQIYIFRNKKTGKYISYESNSQFGWFTIDRERAFVVRADTQVCAWAIAVNLLDSENLIDFIPELL